MKSIIDRVIPPDDPKKVASWRWIIAVCVLALLANGVMGRGLTLGGFGAYASETTVQSLSAKIDRGLKLQIATTLRDLKKEECAANGNKAMLQNIIEDYQTQYFDIASERYPLPPCEKET